VVSPPALLLAAAGIFMAGNFRINPSPGYYEVGTDR
jgi:hypothetical protein